MVVAAFTFFWYQDCFLDGYYFFNIKVAESVVGATAFNGLVGNILHIGFMPLVRPDYWRDRFGYRPQATDLSSIRPISPSLFYEDMIALFRGRALLIWSGYIGLGLIQPFVFAYMTGSPHLYTVIQLWSVLGQLLSCIDTSAAGAFTSNVTSNPSLTSNSMQQSISWSSVTSQAIHLSQRIYDRTLFF